MKSDSIQKHALVVLSGGQDSITCLGYALRMYAKVSAISFRYNQRHEVEIQGARTVCDMHKVPHRIIDLGLLLAELAPSALTNLAADDAAVAAAHPLNANLPASFVPVRNALFFTLAHGHAQAIGAECIITGICQTDYSGYPDCRQAFLTSFGAALNLGYQTHIQFLAPLMSFTKAQTFLLAEEMDFMGEVLELSHTCYNGHREVRHEWGYGCGECPACQLRKKGYAEYLEIRRKNDAAVNEVLNGGDK